LPIGGKGLITYRTTEKTGRLAGIALVDDTNDVILISDSGVIIRMAASEIPVLLRNTLGVTLMKTRDGRVVDIAVVAHEEPEADYGDGETVYGGEDGADLPDGAAGPVERGQFDDDAGGEIPSQGSAPDDDL